MQFDEVVQARRSIRNFKPDPVSDQDISDILKTARLAPSGSNIQPWRFIIIRSQEMKEKLKATTIWRFPFRAPVIIACCFDRSALDSRPKRAAELIQAGALNDVEIEGEFVPKVIEQEQELQQLYLNVGIAITHMVLKAVDLGLGTCWVGGFEEDIAKKILELDENLHVIALLPIGYPERIPAPRPRFPLEKLIVKTV